MSGDVLQIQCVQLCDFGGSRTCDAKQMKTNSCEFNKHNHDELDLHEARVASKCCLSIGAYANRHVFHRATLVS